MKFKDLRKVFSQYQLADIYDGNNLIYSNDVFESIPKKINEKKVKSVDIIKDTVTVHLGDEKMNGFTFPYGQKTVFVETTRKYRTENLAKNILKEMKLPNDRVHDLFNKLQKTDCEIKQLSNGTDWYSMTGKMFTECGPLNSLIHIRIA